MHMQALFYVSETSDDAGVPTYKAMLWSDLDSEGIPDPSAPVGWGETAWQAIAFLCEQVDSVDPYRVLFATESS
jgi:hypothetical protein